MKISNEIGRCYGSRGGKVDIGAGSMDYTTRVSVVGTPRARMGRTVEPVARVTVPVKVSGPLDRLAWNIDWNVAAQEALKSQVTQKLTPQIQA